MSKTMLFDSSTLKMLLDSADSEVTLQANIQQRDMLLEEIRKAQHSYDIDNCVLPYTPTEPSVFDKQICNIEKRNNSAIGALDDKFCI